MATRINVNPPAVVSPNNYIVRAYNAGNMNRHRFVILENLGIDNRQNKDPIRDAVCVFAISTLALSIITAVGGILALSLGAIFSGIVLSGIGFLGISGCGAFLMFDPKTQRYLEKNALRSKMKNASFNQVVKIDSDEVLKKDLFQKVLRGKTDGEKLAFYSRLRNVKDDYERMQTLSSQNIIWVNNQYNQIKQKLDQEREGALNSIERKRYYSQTSKQNDINKVEIAYKRILNSWNQYYNSQIHHIELAKQRSLQALRVNYQHLIEDSIN